MNERVKELAEKSGLGWYENHCWSIDSYDVSKFVDLIVKDCAYIADKNWSTGAPTGKIMLDYFGVDDE